MKKERMIVRGMIVLLIALFAVILGCTKKTDQSESESAQSAEYVMKGKDLFMNYCIHCHGESGMGNGFNALNLDPRPRDLTDSVEVFMAELTNEDIFSKILSRDIMDPEEAERILDDALANDTEIPFMVPSVMPTFKYTLSDEERWALVAYLRTLHKNTAPPVKIPPDATTSRPEFSVREAPSWDLSDDERAELVERGKFLFKEKYSCIGCHRINEFGGTVGPDLSRSGFRLVTDWTYQWIGNPQALKPDTKMPNLGLSENEAKAITLYLQSLKSSVTS